MLCDILRESRKADIGIEYIETNASWFSDPNSSRKILESLGNEGLYALLVSMSPFHNEYIPYCKTQGILEAAAEAGIHTIPWIEQLKEDLLSFDVHTPHSLQEYIDKFGQDYVMQLPSRYWIYFCGRALNTYRPLLQTLSLEDILKYNPGTCRKELLNTSHFHTDHYGYYIPKLCIGIAIDLEDLPGPLDRKRYPLIYLLAEKGISGLYHFAMETYGFVPQRNAYLGKCDLCDEIRSFLSQQESFTELHPDEYYTSL